MKFTTTAELLAAQKADPKYDYVGRMGYYTIAAFMADPARHKRVLEVGPWLCPLVVDADYLDRTSIPNGPTVRYVHDATVLPWPIEDNQYDLIVALQFLEHMFYVEEEVFAEMLRIAPTVIISLPFEWSDSKDRGHNGINREVIRTWTGREPAQSDINIDRLGYARIVNRYERDAT